MLSIILGTVCIAFLVHQWIQWRRAIISLNDLPGYRTLINIETDFITMLPNIHGFSPGKNFYFREKHSIYRWFGADIISAISAWPTVKKSLIVSDANAIKEIVTHRTRFPKPVYRYKVLSLYGDNIVITEHDAWKKYRKIAAPAFSEKNNRMVWDASVRVVEEMFDVSWKKQDRIVVKDCVKEVTLPIALSIIGIAGFGSNMSWKEDEDVPPNHKLSFKHALHTVTSNIFIKLLTPGWVLGLTKKLRAVDLGYKELGRYMEEMVRQRQEEGQGNNHDLFSNLIEANQAEDDGAQKLTEQELIGNIFIFLVAGHETTAHSLTFAFALLALHPEEQENLYQHVLSVLGGKTALTYEHMSSLTYPLAILHETIRLFPPVPGIPKMCAEDTTLDTENMYGKKITIHVPEGTGVTINTAGLHYNPRYWEDPGSFKPSRFLGDWPRDAFAAFSLGPRSCVGRRFTETEAVAVLSTVISQYTIEVSDSYLPGVSFEEKKERLLQTTVNITLTPGIVPLVFKRRKQAQIPLQ